MGVPAFYRWLSEKYPKIVQDVLEERVHVMNGTRFPFDATLPNPSGLECDNFYIDMNGIIHPCSHPENGPQPCCEEEMYENVCRYVDRLFRAVRPRRLLYLAIDGVAPRAKMNQQRSRRFRSAQEAREKADLEDNIRQHILDEEGEEALMPLLPGEEDEEKKMGAGWDSNVITPGTPFMLKLSEYLRFYVRKRISTDKAWQNVRVLFSDASIPGEGEHKLIHHIRRQRASPKYNPNLVHVLHGLDADLIMLALATHEVNFFILREEVAFGRRSMENTQRRRQLSGHTDAQRHIDESAGMEAMELPENTGKPLERISIAVLREYLAIDFHAVMMPPFRGERSFERLIDDIVFLCFFVGNDFLPHLPSLDIRDGALDFLFNVYKRLLPTLGDYLTNHGGFVNLSNVDVILAEVGSIEDYVFQMKHENEMMQRARQNRNIGAPKNRGGGTVDAFTGDRVGHAVSAIPNVGAAEQQQPIARKGRAARAMEQQKKPAKTEKKEEKDDDDKMLVLGRGHAAKEQLRRQTKNKTRRKGDNGLVMHQSYSTTTENANAAEALKASLTADSKNQDESFDEFAKKEDSDKTDDTKPATIGTKRGRDEGEENDNAEKEEVDVDEDMFGLSSDEEDAEAATAKKKQAAEDEATRRFKARVKEAEQKQLEQYAANVKDNVRLHEKGFKDRYYRDKCKADDVRNHGGREHLIRSYVVGLCWVMKYYYSGCPSWKWYYPFHYAPFASDLRNIERFREDCDSFEPGKPFRPVEQLMAVLPADSSHAVPKATRWLMSDPESPILDFYPKDVPVDPNGKAMPWLWVVLLPFIDEERLLEAMKPTMKKWKKSELLCNARGLDDGYLYVHLSHPLAGAMKRVLTVSKESSEKLSVSTLAPALKQDIAGFFRPPLSNETFAADAETVVPPPPSSDSISFGSHDSLFSDPIEPNNALCVAFSEPQKLGGGHRSVLLRGAKLPKPLLTVEDRLIHRPKLNRGGKNISHLGTTSCIELARSGRLYNNPRIFQNGSNPQNNLSTWNTLEPISKRPRSNQNQPGAGNFRPQLLQGALTNGAPPFQSFNGGRVHQHQQAAPPRTHTRFNSEPATSNNTNSRSADSAWNANQHSRGVPPPPPPPPPRYNHRQHQQQKPKQQRSKHRKQRRNQQAAQNQSFQRGAAAATGGYQPQKFMSHDADPTRYSHHQQQDQYSVHPNSVGASEQSSFPPPQHMQPSYPSTLPPPPHPSLFVPPRGMPPRPQHGYSFQAHGQHQQQSHYQQPTQHQQQPQQPQQPTQVSAVNPALISSLRSQLASTLQRYNQNGGRGGN